MAIQGSMVGKSSKFRIIGLPGGPGGSRKDGLEPILRCEKAIKVSLASISFTCFVPSESEVDKTESTHHTHHKYGGSDQQVGNRFRECGRHDEDFPRLHFEVIYCPLREFP